LFAHPLGAVHQ
jgi:hypothetical protein